MNADDVEVPNETGASDERDAVFGTFKKENFPGVEGVEIGCCWIVTRINITRGFLSECLYMRCTRRHLLTYPPRKKLKNKLIYTKVNHNSQVVEHPHWLFGCSFFLDKAPTFVGQHV
jgi:hypothetical protein